jgi:predicted PolB exonuclease-like 3'-5' exonuclease
MLDLPIAAFDIETVPDPDYGRRALQLEGDDGSVIRRMVELRLEATEGKSEYPQQPVHRIVAICVAWLDPGRRRFELEAFGRGAWDEGALLRDFARLLERKPAPRLVSWNGNGFDLPILRYRSMVHRVPMPGLCRSEGAWRWNNYGNRYHTMHVDLMDVLAGYGASRFVGLGLLGDVLGLPNKKFLEGSVYEQLLRGEEEQIREYCKLDVVTTLLAYLRWCVHRGDLDAEGEMSLVALIGRGLEAERYQGWREVAAGLGANLARAG